MQIASCSSDWVELGVAGGQLGLSYLMIVYHDLPEKYVHNWLGDEIIVVKPIKFFERQLAKCKQP